jgi:hypothetical protein
MHNEIGTMPPDIGHDRLQSGQVAMDIRDHCDSHNTSMTPVRSAANRVLHSGVDGKRGHFIAAYGTEMAERSGAS